MPLQVGRSAAVVKGLAELEAVGVGVVRIRFMGANGHAGGPVPVEAHTIREQTARLHAPLRAKRRAPRVVHSGTGGSRTRCLWKWSWQGRQGDQELICLRAVRLYAPSSLTSERGYHVPFIAHKRNYYSINLNIIS